MLFTGIELKLNAQYPDRKNKRIPFILYDGITTNILTHGSKSNPDSICIKQTGDNIFVNGDLINVSHPEKWQPNTDISPYLCQ